jgi:hypothetical protein
VSVRAQVQHCAVAADESPREVVGKGRDVAVDEAMLSQRGEEKGVGRRVAPRAREEAEGAQGRRRAFFGANGGCAAAEEGKPPDDDGPPAHVWGGDDDAAAAADTSFTNTHRPKRLRKKLFERLSQLIEMRFDSKLFTNTVPRFLAALNSFYWQDLLAVKAELPSRFPESYEIVRFYVEQYHGKCVPLCSSRARPFCLY